MGDTVLVFGHAVHNIEDRATRVLYQIRPGMVREMPEELARQVADSFPLRVCLLAGQDTPDQHDKKCAKSKAYKKQLKEELEARDTGYETTVMDQPKGRVSAQRKLLKKQTLRRSGRARRENAREKAKAS